MVEQLGSSCVAQRWPVAALGNLDAALVRHLEEEQIRDLLDVVAVVDSIVAQGVAKAPERVDDIGHDGLAERSARPAGRSGGDVLALHSLLVEWAARFADPNAQML